jgi:hypothetical protein
MVVHPTETFPVTELLSLRPFRHFEDEDLLFTSLSE